MLCVLDALRIDRAHIVGRSMGAFATLHFGMAHCVPKTGHAVNLEEPQAFNQLLDDFLHQVAQGHWGARDARAMPESSWGPGGKPALT